MKRDPKQLQNYINDMKALSKSRWYYELSYKIHDIHMNSRVDCECIDILKGGDKSHYKKKNTMNMKK